MDTVLSHFAVSVTELKRNYAGILKQADQGPVAVLNHNRPEGKVGQACYYGQRMVDIEDLEDARLGQDRAQGAFVQVTVDAL